PTSNKLAEREAFCPIFASSRLRLGAVLRLADEIEIDRATLEIEFVDQPGFEIPAILFGQLFLPVAEYANSERPVSRLRRIINSKPPAGDRRRRIALREISDNLIQLRRGKF